MQANTSQYLNTEHVVYVLLCQFDLVCCFECVCVLMFIEHSIYIHAHYNIQVNFDYKLVNCNVYTHDSMCMLYCMVICTVSLTKDTHSY